MSSDALPAPQRDDLLAAIQRRLTSDAPSLSDVDAVVRFDGGPDARCCVLVRRGVVRMTTESTKATTTITSDATTLLDVIEGRTSGVEAFLDRRLRVDGDLSLSLRLDGLFGAADERPARFSRSRMLQVGSIRTFSLEAGPADALPIVGLHGLGATNASLLPTIWDLGVDHHVLTPDLPGHGATAAPRGRYDARFFAAWLVHYLDLVGVERAVLLGNSLGGRIALEVALLAPDRVRGVVLLAPAVAFRRFRQLVPVARLARPELAALPMPVTRAMANLSIRYMFARPDRLTAQSYDAAAGEFVRVYRRPAYRVAFFRSLRQIYIDNAFGRKGFWRALPSLSCPALFVWGERDRLVPAGFARHVTAALPDATSVVLPDCGHVPQFELPERTHELVRAFLADLAAPA